MNQTGLLSPRAATEKPARQWRPATNPPGAYELAVLAFEDGASFRGTWTGKMWWGYDPRTSRSRELHPVAWLPWG
jgi:hypothetical protein